MVLPVESAPGDPGASGTTPPETQSGLEFLTEAQLKQIKELAKKRGPEAAAAEVKGLMDT